jgi:hypothetical protein
MRQLHFLSAVLITSLPALLASIGGCGSEAGTGGSTLPPPAKATPFAAEGTFTNCAAGSAGPNGNVFLNGGGFQPGTLTLKTDGSKVTADFAVGYGSAPARSIEFESQGPASATLASAQQLDAFAGICVTGPGEPEPPYPATLSANEGSLIYSSRTAFLWVNGTLAGKLGACGEQSTPKTLWVACGDGPTVAAADVGESASAEALPVGTYSCDSFIATDTHSGGETLYGGTGGAGTLTLARSSTGVTATYRKDSTLEATLELDAVGQGTAVARPGQSLSTFCNPAVAQTAALPITAASLEVNKAALSLSFVGTMPTDSTCPDTQIVGNVTCYAP